MILCLMIAFVWAYSHLGLRGEDLHPSSGGLKVLGEFAARALTPALTSEADFVPEGTRPLLYIALSSARTTLFFAAAGMSLGLFLGIVLGFFSSTSWWAGDFGGVRRSSPSRILGRVLFPVLYGGSRVIINLMRSTHEVLWAVLFLTAFGLSNTAAVLAIAIPYGGTLAKIFSEMVDETTREPAHALRGAGASGLQTYSFALVPQALPDMIGYSFYRFECALRSSAILGFFGFPTLGLFIRQSFSSLNYGEVWTFLYVLLGMVLIFDWWSGAVRRRLAP